PLRRRYAPAHSASPPLLPAPTSNTTRRPEAVPTCSTSSRAAVTDTPNAARRINVSAGIRRINSCSAARTRSVSHTPRISHLPHRTGRPTGAHARKFGRSSETFVVVLLFPYGSQAETTVGEPLPSRSVRG